PSPAVANNTSCTVPAGATVIVSPANAIGLNTSGSLGQITADGTNVNLAATNTTAAMALQGASINFNGGTIQTTSVGAAATGQTGLRASGSSSRISASDATINVTPASGTSNNMRGAVAELGGS